MEKRKKIFKILFISIFLVLTSLPSTIGLYNYNKTDGKIDCEQVFFRANNIDESTIKINVNPFGFEYGIVDTDLGQFASLSLSDHVYNSVEGQAKLPIIRKMIEIPQDSEPVIKISSVNWEFTSLNDLKIPDRIIPSQQSFEKIPESSTDFILDENYYSSNVFLPDIFAKILEIGEMRSRRFALVEISPIQYKPVNGELKIMKSCEIIIDLKESDMAKTYDKIQRYYSPSFEKIFDNAFENYGFYEKEVESRSREGYLVLVYSDFYDEVQSFLNLKDTKGYDMSVVKTSDITGGPTKENIRDYIQDAYDDWEIPPVYILLIGDTPQIPTFHGSTGPSAVDLYYTTVDGSDYFPDIFIGRLPASSIDEVEAMIEKTIYYEMGGFNSTSWIKKGAFLASTENYIVTEETHNYVIDNYLIPDDYICDKLYSYTYDATTQDVNNSINDGRSLLVFSGHGGPSGWSDGPPFAINDVKILLNKDMYPFVCSHACSTNTFDDSECFGETWLREKEKAGIAFWGASASTYWSEDDVLERAMFQSWWDDGIESISGMTDMALLYLYENYSGGELTKYYFEAYNLLGDPAMIVWRDSPSLPPETPQKPIGPEEWVLDIEATFEASTTDPEGNNIYYMFNWGDGNYSGWIGPFVSGAAVTATHSWTNIGTYEVKVMAKDIYQSQSNWSEHATITIIKNTPPAKPTIVGPMIGITKKYHDFTFNSTDADGHSLYYYISWGDGDYLNWEGPYASGESVTFSHTWHDSGYFGIVAIVKDQFDLKAPQSSFSLLVMKNRASIYPRLTSLFERVIDRSYLLKYLFL